MKRARVMLVACALCSGCYLAHERDVDDVGPADAPSHDAATRDVAFPDAVALDAAPACELHCEAPEVLASAQLPVFTPYGSFLEDVIVVVTPDALFGVALASFPDSATNAELRPTLFRVSRATGELEWMPFPERLHSHPVLHAADLTLRGDSLDMLVLQTSLVSDHRDAMVGRGTWSASALVLTAEADALLTAPFSLVPSLNGDATAFGGPSLDLAAFTDLGFVRAFVVPTAGEPRLVDLVALSDVGATAPLSGTVLADGRIAITGGGVDGLGTAAREPFFAIGRIEDAPLAAQAVVGAAHDAPPMVTAEGTGYLIARHVTNDADLLRSAIHIEHHAADGSLSAAAQIPTTNGRRPLAMSVFAEGGHAGIAWLEHDQTARDRLDLRVLTPDLDRGCPSIGSASLATIDAMYTGFGAAAAEDGTVYVVTVVPNPGPIAPTVTVTRVSPCVR